MDAGENDGQRTTQSSTKVSGTSGQPTSVWVAPMALQAWAAKAEAVVRVAWVVPVVLLVWAVKVVWVVLRVWAVQAELVAQAAWEAPVDLVAQVGWAGKSLVESHGGGART